MPSTPHNAVISPCPPNSTLTLFRHLIDEDSPTWNKEVVTATFLPFEAEIILKIPLSSYSQDDMLIWGGTKNGAYAVLSGYHFLLNESHRADPGPSDISLLTKVWNTVWSLQVPPKVRHFLWQASHESLPTRNNLHRRHVIDDPMCTSCNSEPESTLHILWLCSITKQLWQSVPWHRKLIKDTYSDFQEHLLNCVQTLSTTELKLFAMMSWSLWYQRNCVRLNKPVEPVASLLPRTYELLQEYIDVQERPIQNQIQAVGQIQSRTTVSWKPPAMGRVKINYDGAVFNKTGEAGIGVIIRNPQGVVMASLSQRIPFPHSVEAVEATAARVAVQLAYDLGFKEVEVEGDSINIVQALSQTEPNYTLYGHIINDTKFTSQLLVSVHFLHVKREGNKVAHSLAKRARCNQPFQVWMEFVPPDIVPILYSDFSFQ